MLTALTLPTTSNLMAPETVLGRLKLPESELEDVELQVAEASALVARYLGFRPEYSPAWEETFSGVAGGILDLGARPAWSVASVSDRALVPLGATAYQLVRGPYGESSILRTGTWDLYYGGGGAWAGLTAGWAAGTTLPDWTAVYAAGWWLEEMTGAIPAGVERFPVELQADFLNILRWRRATATFIPGIKRMKDEGAEVEFFGASDQAVDPRTGIPNACTLAMQYYRRP